MFAIYIFTLTFLIFSDTYAEDRRDSSSNNSDEVFGEVKPTVKFSPAKGLTRSVSDVIDTINPAYTYKEEIKERKK